MNDLWSSFCEDVIFLSFMIIGENRHWLELRLVLEDFQNAEIIKHKALFCLNVKANSLFFRFLQAVTRVQEHFQIYLVSLKLTIELSNSMTTSEYLEIQTSLFMNFICNLSIEILLKLVNAVNLYLIFSQSSSLIKAHDLQMRWFYSLFRLGSKHIAPLQPHQTEGID